MRPIWKLIRKRLLLPGILLLWLAVHSVAILYFAHSSPKNQADWGVIWGNQVFPDSSLSQALQQRMDLGLALLQEGKIKGLIVSGATGVEGVNEAQIMARYLRQNGVADSLIRLDTNGTSTWATAANVSPQVSQEDRLLAANWLTTRNFQLLS